jgi:pimeloyl-ACP methyl ester carboxylesterase
MSGGWQTGYTTAPGFRMFYRDWQAAKPPQQDPVLALHGSLVQSGMWIDLAERLGAIRMLCPDQRGFGLSEDPPGDAASDFALDALRLADAMRIERFTLMAHSFAGAIAVEAACRAPERIRSLVLVDPVVRMGQPVPPLPASARPEAFASLEEAAGHFTETEEGEWPQAALRRFVQDIMLTEGASGAYRFPYSASRLRRLRAFQSSAQGDYYNFLEKAASVHCPVLVFRGGASKRFAASAEQPLRRAFGGEVTVVACPRSGHFPTVSEPDIVARGLAQFLAAQVET